MARTPDELLGIIRVNQAGGVSGISSAEAFAELDALLSSGGPLPTDWAVALDRAADDVPLPGGTL